jgi:hypothetical protein
MRLFFGPVEANSRLDERKGSEIEAGFFSFLFAGAFAADSTFAR